jgi:DNA-binding HxlR family transcriptional regulator
MAMTVRTQWSDVACPIARALDVLGDPWALLILREVFIGNRRYDGLKGELGIADTVLSKRLRTLVESGLLDRAPYGGTTRPRVEYVLTDAGVDTLPVLHALARWGRRHTASPVPGRNLLVECLECGHQTESADWCPTCAAPLDRDRTGWRRARDPQRLIPLAAA